MKEARYLEKDIAQALIDQGRTAYNPKTIGTRWRRLKAALQKRQDDLLDADLTDWHEGDVRTHFALRRVKSTDRARMTFSLKPWPEPIKKSKDSPTKSKHENGALWLTG